MAIKMELLSCLLLAGVLMVSGSFFKKRDPIVSVKQGKLQGSVLNLVDGGTYYSFKGIPYAQPPVGELRFRAPLPPVAWSGIRNATAHGVMCTQYDWGAHQIIEGSEDCLFLNVYTKTLKRRAKIPVMVYIHGGAYMAGSGDNNTCGPEFLLEHDVVVVTMNYRLEVLGFLSLDTPEVPGNAGMKDQVFALRWVQENIAKFGGDPDNVTIFGESAGSCAVTSHILSPMSSGLFHKVIAHSGVAILDWAIARDTKERAFRVAKYLGKETTDTQELLDYLRSVPAVDLAGVTYQTRTLDEELRAPPMYFVPTVEKKFDNVEAFLTVEPTEALVSQKVNKVPLLVGYNTGEGLLFLADQIVNAPQYNDNSSYLVPRELVPKLTSSQLKDFGQRIKNFYFGEKVIGNDTLQEITDMNTDLHFLYNIHRFAHLFSKTDIPVYMFRFEYETELNIYKSSLGYSELQGVMHADDLFYVFYNDLNKELYAKDKNIQKVIKDVTRLWTNFAKTSNPTPAGSSVLWPRYSGAGREFLILDEVMTSSSRADQARVDFLNNMYREAGVPYIA